MARPFPCFTCTWHAASYPAISPNRPELSAKGKSVVIIGGGSGIGASTARSFAAAGSTQIAILGRREHVLANTASLIEAEFKKTTVLPITTDVLQQEFVNTAFKSVLKLFGRIDICINSAGFFPTPGTVLTSNFDDWWMAYETNVKGSIHIARSFLQSAKEGSTLINISSGEANMPALFSGHSSYVSSKLAAAKIFEYVAAEHPEMKVFNVHPGVIGTEMSKKNGSIDLDNVELPGHFCVWLASPESSFLHGRFVWANWDVEELIIRKEDISRSQDLLTVGLTGVSFEDWGMSNIVEYIKQQEAPQDP